MCQPLALALTYTHTYTHTSLQSSKSDHGTLDFRARESVKN